MHVIKRDGRVQPVHFDKITSRIVTLCYGLDMNYVDPSAITHRVISGFYSGMTTVELDTLAADTAASMIDQHMDYGILAGRIAISNLHKETKKVFSEVITQLHHGSLSIMNKRMPIISEKYFMIIQDNADRLNSAIIYDRDFNYSYATFKMLESKHLLRLNGKVVERPQHMLMRVAVCIHDEDIDKAIETYNFLSKQYFIYAAQTLNTACTIKQQMFSSFLVTMSEDSIDGILDSLERVATLCCYNGDIGFNVHCIRAKNTPIRGTGGVSNGLIPMLKAYNTSIPTVCKNNIESPITVYLEPWHSDIFEFLELRRSIGDEQLRAKNMFYALWTPDLFMKRVYDNADWSLMCPHECPGLIEAWGDEFETLYTRYEKEQRYRKQVKAQDLWLRIIKVQAETDGRPYIVYKDHCNRKTNHQNLGTIQCGSLSSEIIQYSNSNEVGACNTAAIAVDMFVNSTTKTYDFSKLKEVVKIVTYNLNKMIDVNLYPLEEAARSSVRHRAIGIGVTGLSDAFILMRYPFESKEAKKLNVQIFETLYYGALEASCEMAIEHGPYKTYEGSPVSKGILQYEMWNVKPTDLWNWDTLKVKIAKHGIRNSLLIAQMSNAFMAQMLGNNESIEPYKSNASRINILSKCHQYVNMSLLQDLIERGLWSKNMCDKIINHEGSIQEIDEIPDDLKLLYKTVWEIPQKTLFEMAAARGPFIDQSQCLMVHMINSMDKLTSIHFYAWEIGLKSSMYKFRSEDCPNILNT